MEMGRLVDSIRERLNKKLNRMKKKEHNIQHMLVAVNGEVEELMQDARELCAIREEEREATNE